MSIKRYKATTPGQRQRMTLVSDNITKGAKPEKRLTEKLKQQAGRNNSGRVTVRHRCAGNKKIYRVIDFNRNKFDVKGYVESIQYDPYRTASICLVKYKDGDKRYIICPGELKVGDEISSGGNVDIKVGNTLPLSKIPTGSNIHNIEMRINGKATMVRAAGTYATLLAKSGKYASVKLPSGEVRQINMECKATIGQVSNSDKRNAVLGKAGIKKKMGFKSKVRGAVKNPCDHPHGGGEGKAPIGRPGPLSPWGKPTLGHKTRNKMKQSNKYIVSRRSK